jgi:hypothetical protein
MAGGYEFPLTSRIDNQYFWVYARLGLISAKTAKKPFRALLLLLLFGFFAHADDFASLIMTTFRTNGMLKPHFTTITALNEGHCCQCIRRPPPVATAF